MKAFDVERARFNMVEQQVRTWDVLDQQVLDLLFTVRREEYVPTAYRTLEFADLEIPLGDGQLMWTPKMEARVLQDLTIRPGERNWWIAAPPHRREELLRAVQSGQIEITALPLNQAPFLDRQEWQQMLSWLPEELGQKVRLRAAVQNDVNGFPRARALALLDHGVQYLWTGINADSGGPPLERPSAFWWKMPDGRRLFVWLSPSYPFAYDLFEPKGWRQGPLPFAADTRYGPPREGDFFGTDEASLRKASEQCRKVLGRFEKAGPPYPSGASEHSPAQELYS